jgi:hypothetical protein
MRAVMLLAALLGGCNILPGHCDQPTAIGTPPTAIELVDPSTNTCTSFSPGFSCDRNCGPCPAGAVALPPWGSCTDPCTALNEPDCAADDTCRITRDTSGTFLGCFGVDTDAGTSDGACDTLDAAGCARHASCIGVYTVTAMQEQFAACVAKN